MLVSVFLFAALVTRVAVSRRPGPDPREMELFRVEAERIRRNLAECSADSIPAAVSSSDAERPELGTAPSARPYRFEAPYTPERKLNLNAADSADLLPLPGIGPVFAGRMIRFRDLLGGFATGDQLMEVYGMDPDRAEAILPLIMIDTSLIRKIKINTVSFRELLRHPYLEYDHVKALIHYREVKGTIVSVREIRINGLLPDSVVSRFCPYVDFSE